MPLMIDAIPLLGHLQMIEVAQQGLDNALYLLESDDPKNVALAQQGLEMASGTHTRSTQALIETLRELVAEAEAQAAAGA